MEPWPSGIAKNPIDTCLAVTIVIIRRLSAAFVAVAPLFKYLPLLRVCNTVHGMITDLTCSSHADLTMIPSDLLHRTLVANGGHWCFALWPNSFVRVYRPCRSSEPVRYSKSHCCQRQAEKHATYEGWVSALGRYFWQTIRRMEIRVGRHHKDASGFRG